jgi:predicted TIM-barrel fold metal-dependent hydrolase
MNMRILCFVTAILAGGTLQDTRVPAVDHHQHLYNPALGALTLGEPVTAADLIKLLDQAGIRRAVLFSIAYQFGNPNRPRIENEYEKVQAENDRVSREVARYPDRLRGFCGVNPLKDYALAEIARCAKDPQMRFGLKMHFGNSDVQLEDPRHVARLREVFRAANQARMAIVMHVRSTISQRRPYGATQARALLTEVLPSAPDVPIQIAHLAGGGGYDDPLIDEAMSVWAAAAATHDPRLAHVYFEVSGVAGVGAWRQRQDLIVARIRQIGVDRILYGSDGAAGPGRSPREAWRSFTELPLTDAEIRTVAGNVASYMR